MNAPTSMSPAARQRGEDVPARRRWWRCVAASAAAAVVAAVAAEARRRRRRWRCGGGGGRSGGGGAAAAADAAAATGDRAAAIDGRIKVRSPTSDFTTNGGHAVHAPERGPRSRPRLIPATGESVTKGVTRLPRYPGKGIPRFSADTTCSRRQTVRARRRILLDPTATLDEEVELHPSSDLVSNPRAAAQIAERADASAGTLVYATP